MVARKANRRGLTLVEVVVLVVVIVILVALLMSGLARNQPARRNTCANHLKQLSLATLAFVETRGYFPGTSNPFKFAPKGKGPTEVGYVVQLLPFVDSQPVYDQWTEGNRITPRVDLLICPAIDDVDPNGNGQLSYVINDGMAATESVDPATIQASGISFDRTGTLYSPIQVDSKYLNEHDGDTQTLLMSENLLANHWNTSDPANAKRWNSFVWQNDPISPAAQINGPAPGDAMSDTSLTFARPSSNHQGGVNVGFCDGRVEFIDSGIDYGVWRQMMTSDHALFP